MSHLSSAPLPRLANKRSRRRALVSLTPLIDVVFILLVFFMLASSFLDWRSIDLSPPGQGADAGATKSVAILVDITERGLHLADAPISTDALMEIVTQRLAENPNQPVVIRPSAGVPLQAAISLLDHLKAAGVTKLSLMRREGT